MRSQNHTGILLNRILIVGREGSNARVVVNLPVFYGHVEVDADEYAFAFRSRSLIELRH